MEMQDFLRAKLKEFGKPLPFKTFRLTNEQKKNDLGTFQIFKVEESRDTTEAELDAVKHWHNIIKSGAARVDESDLEIQVGTAEPAGADPSRKF